MFRIKQNILKFGVFVASAAPFLVFAQQGPPQLSLGYPEIERLIETLANWLFALLMILAVLFVLYAAYNYLTAGGDEDKVKTANHILLYAAIAIAVALLSRGLESLVRDFLSSGAGINVGTGGGGSGGQFGGGGGSF